ncbi:MAG: hypothetical protein WBD31_04735 [Rubripirellula sp.]
MATKLRATASAFSSATASKLRPIVERFVEGLKRINSPIGGMAQRLVGISGLKNAKNFAPFRGQHTFTCGLNCAFHAVGDVATDFSRHALKLRDLIRRQGGLNELQLARFIGDLGDNIFAIRKYNLIDTDIPDLLKIGKVLALVDKGHWIEITKVFTKDGKIWARVFDSGRGGYYDQLLDSLVTRTSGFADRPFIHVVVD